MSKVIYQGHPEATVPILAENGYPAVPVPGQEYELPAKVADALVRSSDSWTKPKAKAPAKTKKPEPKGDDL